MKKVKIALSRQRYRNSPKGKAARKREYKKRKRNGTTTSSKGKRSPPILGGTKNRCKRVGCGKHYEDSSDPRAGEKCYCCEDCRKFMNDFRKRTEENTCPIAAYILAIIELLYGK